jgi:uncharacterized membrane protein YdjX (TVP38/TMEM64 family)
MSDRLKKVIIILGIIVLLGTFFAFDLQRYLTLTELKARQEAFTQVYAANRLLTLGLYFGLYILVTALSLPGAAIMTLAVAHCSVFCRHWSLSLSPALSAQPWLFW